MLRLRLSLLLVALLLAGSAVSASAQGFRPPCRDVISALNKAANDRPGKPSPRRVARQLGTEHAWVVRCMEAYGRTPPENERVSDAEREAFDKALEEGRAMYIDEENSEYRWEKQNRIKVERQEAAERRRRAAQQRELEKASEPNFEGAPKY